MPARRAIATRCTTALVEPPSASTATIALSMLAAVTMSRGFRSSQTMSTMRRPESLAIRAWRESAAGIDAAPGSVKPSASVAEVIVDAVPIVMQWPGERAMLSSICAPRLLGDRAGAELGPVFPDIGAAAERAAAPVAAQHRAARHEDRRQVHADRAHQQRGRRLVAAAHQHAAVGRIRAQQLLRLHREQIAIEHRRRLLERLGQRDRRHLDREAARLPDAALHFLGALPEMRVTRIDVAPRVDDRDDRLALVIGARIAHLRRARPMAERAHVVRSVPAMRAQLCGFLAGGHGEFRRRFSPGHYTQPHHPLRAAVGALYWRREPARNRCCCARRRRGTDCRSCRRARRTGIEGRRGGRFDAGSRKVLSVDLQGPRSRGAERAQQRDPRPGARGHGRGHRRRRPGRHRRLPDRRGRRSEPGRPAGPGASRARRRLRSCDGAGPRARHRSRFRTAVAVGRIGEARRPRSRDDRQSRRRRRRDARATSCRRGRSPAIGNTCSSRRSSRRRRR